MAGVLLWLINVCFHERSLPQINCMAICKVNVPCTERGQKEEQNS